MNCTFCRVLAGEINAHVVAEDDHLLAFLDHRPLFLGHVLVVPRQHLETLADLSPHDTTHLFQAVRLLSIAVPRAMEAQGSFVALNNRISQSVPHLHVHVVPRRKGDGLRGFFWPRTRYSGDDQMAEVAAKIRVAYQRSARNSMSR